MPARQQPCRKIREDHDTEQDVQRFSEVVGRQERGGDDEQQRHDVERQQGIAETNALRRRALVKASDILLQARKRHSGIFTAHAHHCK